MYKWTYYFYDYSEPAIDIETKELDRQEADKILIEKHGKIILKRAKAEQTKAAKKDVVRACYFRGFEKKRSYKKNIRIEKTEGTE